MDFLLGLLTWTMGISLWASIQALVGMYFLTNLKNRWGCLISLTNQVPWVILAFMVGTYGTLLLSGAMIFITVRGWLRWNKNV
ncbi:hypothetical protein LCGC14_0364420 [marine sediment metagenome]|uniref:Uncharacterized protein n=1 Tax=marine sediment metagenome TaxID=412755 RepID=A0A0F9VUF7_9ZZZZ